MQEFQKCRRFKKPCRKTLHGSLFIRASEKPSGLVHRDDLFFVIRSASLADSVGSHQGSAFAAANKRRSGHFPGCSSAVSSRFGMLIFRTDRHGSHLLIHRKDITDFRHSWIQICSITVTSLKVKVLTADRAQPLTLLTAQDLHRPHQKCFPTDKLIHIQVISM